MRSDNATGVFAFLLLVLSILYSAIITMRVRFYQWGLFRTHRLSCKVISIGNITLGGAGKTPMTIYLAKTLYRLGFRVVILSRGYKGQLEQSCSIITDGKTVFMDPETAGDEPYLMAEKLTGIPIVVGKNRYECGQLAIKKFTPQVILLDDAFQHLSLYRDINIVLMDFTRPLGNRHVIPRGLLREPAPNVDRSDLVILTRADIDHSHSQTVPYVGNKPVFRCRHEPDQLMHTDDNGNIVLFSPDKLTNQKVYAFSGIANNYDFVQMLSGLQYQITGSSGFDDHHNYSDFDLETIAANAQNSSAKFIVTTEKDYVKIVKKINWPLPIFALGIKLNFGLDSQKFESIIQSKMVT